MSVMARGWESKSVEQQQADMANQGVSDRPRLSAAQQELNRKRDGLRLSRKCLADRLQSTNHPQHRQMLEQAVAEIDRQLSSFDTLTEPPALK